MFLELASFAGFLEVLLAGFKDALEGLELTLDGDFKEDLAADLVASRIDRFLDNCATADLE